MTPRQHIARILRQQTARRGNTHQPAPITSGATGKHPCGDQQHSPETIGHLKHPDGKATRTLIGCSNRGCTWTYTFDAIHNT